MVQAVEVQQSQKQLLFNLMQKYLYEMTAYYENKMDESGNYPYPYLPRYFEEPGRQAYFFYDDAVLIGFALINQYSFTGDQIDNCIAEFTIFPAYRRHGKGSDAVRALIKQRKGSWQLKYSTDNPSGTAFWRKIKEEYHGQEQALEGTEIALTLHA